MREEIMVSVICLTYNHEGYIREALKGFVCQRTDFKFEVIVHDDASTDQTKNIIQEYERKYPEIIKPIYQIENQYSKSIPIIKNYILPKCSGKYLAWCEGDDFWTDDRKLQIQVDIMEKNPSCVACLSKVEKVNIRGEPLNHYIPESLYGDRLICGEDFVKYVLNPGIRDGFPMQISGFMLQKEVYMKYIDEPPPYKAAFSAVGIGDIPLALFSGLSGDVYYLDRVMSHYRTSNPQSYIGRTHNNNKDSAVHFREKAKAYLAFDLMTAYRFHSEAEKAVQYANFCALLKEHDIKNMKNDVYWWLFDSLPWPNKVYHSLLHYCPLAEKPLRNFQHYLNHHGIIK